MAATLPSLKAELETILDQENSVFEEYNLVHDSMNHYDLRLIVPVGQAKPSAEFLPRMEDHLLHCLQKKLQPLTKRRDELLRLIGEMEREEKFGVGFKHLADENDGVGKRFKRDDEDGQGNGKEKENKRG